MYCIMYSNIEIVRLSVQMDFIHLYIVLHNLIMPLVYFPFQPMANVRELFLPLTRN